MDMERFDGLNVRSFSPIEAFTEIPTHCLGQKCLLISLIKERCLYSRENFHRTLENCQKLKSLAQQIFPRLQYLLVSMFKIEFNFVS